MNNDRELLELAAKAAGYNLDWSKGYPCRVKTIVCADTILHDIYSDLIPWNPLTDDGDALRLAVKLGLTVETLQTTVSSFVFYKKGVFSAETLNDDPYAATRRAIVRAAAEIVRG